MDLRWRFSSFWEWLLNLYSLHQMRRFGRSLRSFDYWLGVIDKVDDGVFILRFWKCTVRLDFDFWRWLESRRTSILFQVFSFSIWSLLDRHQLLPPDALQRLSLTQGFMGCWLLGWNRITLIWDLYFPNGFYLEGLPLCWYLISELFWWFRMFHWCWKNASRPQLRSISADYVELAGVHVGVEVTCGIELRPCLLLYAVFVLSRLQGTWPRRRGCSLWFIP